MKSRRKGWVLVLAIAMTMQFGGCGKDNSSAGPGAVQDSIVDLTKEADTPEQSENLQEESSESTEEVPSEDYAIDWKDSGFEEYMRMLTGIRDRDIMFSDVQDITELDLSYADVKDYSALENFPNLKVLSVICFGDFNIEVLNPLENLEELTLTTDTAIQAGGTVVNLPNLSVLRLGAGEMKSLDMLPFDLSGLKELELSAIGLEDITGLSALSELETLSLQCDVGSLEELSGLTNLKELDLSNCFNLSSIDALSSLPNLTTLNLSWCENITGIDALGGLDSLSTLDLSYCNNVKNIDVLYGLPGLETLVMTAGEDFHMDILGGLQNLTALDIDLGWNENVDLGVLAELGNLSSLRISGGGYGKMDLEVLYGLEGLTSLDLAGYDSTEADLDRLVSGLPGLTTLKLGMIVEKDVSALAGLSDLKDLEIYNAYEFDFHSLSGLTGLEKFALVYYQGDSQDLNAVDALSALPNLTELDLSGCRGLDVNLLSGLTNLRTLNLSRCDLTDISGLADLTNLMVLDVSENMIDDYSPVSFVPEIRR